MPLSLSYWFFSLESPDEPSGNVCLPVYQVREPSFSRDLLPRCPQITKPWTSRAPGGLDSGISAVSGRLWIGALYLLFLHQLKSPRFLRKCRRRGSPHNKGGSAPAHRLGLLRTNDRQMNEWMTNRWVALPSPAECGEYDSCLLLTPPQTVVEQTEKQQRAARPAGLCRDCKL